MAATELYGSRSIIENPQQVTGQRIFKAPYDTWRSDCPTIGAAFPGHTLLRLRERRMEPLNPDKSTGDPAEWVKVTCDYSTYQYIEDAPIESGEFSGEVLETTLGRTWATTGRRSMQSFGVTCPMMEWCVKMTTAAIPKAAIIANINKVNVYTWLDFPAETLLFQGASWDNRYDYERQTYIYSVTFKFCFRPLGWNVVWRAPEQMRDAEGNLVWEDDGAGGGGVPVWVPGDAGIGGWDRLVPALYQWGDFNPLLGWPPIVLPWQPE